MTERTIAINAAANISKSPRSWPWDVMTALNKVRTLTDELKTDRTGMKTAADAVETLIEELHDDGGTRKTWEDEVDADLDVINNFIASLGEQDGVIGGDYTIAEATATEMTGAGSIVWRIGGEVYYDNALQAAIAPSDSGTTKVTNNLWGAYRVVIDRLGVVTCEAADTAGYAGEEDAYLHLASVAQAANTCVIGYFAIHAPADAGGFIPGTDVVDDGAAGSVYLLRRPLNEATALWAAMGSALTVTGAVATYNFGTVSPKIRGLRLATIAADGTQVLTDADTIANGEAGGIMILTDLAGTDVMSLSSDGVPGVTALTDTDAAGALTALNLVAARLPAMFCPLGHIIITMSGGGFTATSTQWDDANIASVAAVDQSFGTFDRTVTAATFLARESNPPT
ncbi:hypothetical protein LCGC14_2453830, partial [marine sediment metagenome]